MLSRMRSFAFALILLVVGGSVLAAEETTKPATRPERKDVFAPINPKLPTLWLIGDSTVRNGRDTGDNGQWGWGNPIAHYFDTTKINVQNRALGGTSSRTYRNLGKWDEILPLIKPGDYLMINFGHNDNAKLDDPARARGTLKGNGEETQEIDNPITKKHEVVHTYGWYIRQYIKEAKEKGVKEIVVLSLTPRNNWADGKAARNTTYAVWAKQAAETAGVEFIDLNERTCEKLDAAGEQKSTELYYPEGEKLHPDWAGAVLNAESVVEGLKEIKGSTIASYLLANPPKDLKNPSGKAR